MDIIVLYISLILTTTAIPAVSGDTPLGCDEGWVNNFNYCYLFNNAKTVTWQQASDECNRYASSILYFDNTTEEAWYTNYVRQNSATSKAAYWTALNDVPLGAASKAGNGNWKWGSYSQVDPSLITWSSSPANDGKANCGGINLQGKMSDLDCNSKQGYICNIELPDGGGCPVGWLPTMTDCYWVSNTSDPSQLLSWNDAKAKCQSLYNTGHLLTIDDVNDQSFVTNQLTFLTKNAYLHWTGLQYNNGQWKWFNGATFNPTLFQWSNEPDNVAGAENCAVVRYNGKFSDRDCNSQQYFICKKTQDYSNTLFNLGCGTWTRAGLSCYMFYQQPLSSWQNARQKCQQIQADLINVKSLDTQTWLNEQLLSPDIVRPYWTGLTDSANEGSFVWTDGTPMNNNVIAWNQEPNDYKGQEDCGLLKVNGYYNDVSCSLTKAAAVCELDNTPSCPSKGGSWLQRKADFGQGNNCYLFTSYSSASALYLQSEAAKYCQSLAINATLVPFLLAIDSQNEKAFIINQVKKYSDNPYGYHTSLNDKQSEGYWSFSNSKDLSADPNLIDWSGEPNNQTADTDCVNVNYGGYYEVKKCSELQSFICQKPVSAAWIKGNTGPSPPSPPSRSSGPSGPSKSSTSAGQLTPLNFAIVFLSILTVFMRQ